MFDFGILRAAEMWDGLWQLEMRFMHHGALGVCYCPSFVPPAPPPTPVPLPAAPSLAPPDSTPIR